MGGAASPVGGGEKEGAEKAQAEADVEGDASHS